jgi:hypothetical protein
MELPQSVRNAENPWTAEEVDTLRKFAEGNIPACVIGVRLGRPEAAVQQQASASGIELEPANRPPYGG